jgi:predicted DCC family thiol-disulfide oxidoreductase YuxK
VHTEITDILNTTGRDWVCYDADCSLCVRWAGRFRTLLEKHGFLLMPLQSAAVRAALRLPEDDLLKEMRVITRTGTVIGGADAVVYLSRFVFKPLIPFTWIPGAKTILRAAYRYIARNRDCTGKTCELKRTGETPVPLKSFRVGNPADWLPLPILVLAAAVNGRQFPAWLYMWALAFALFAGCKWLCFRKATRVQVGVGRKIGFLFGWIGMDAADFFATHEATERPQPGELAFAGLKLFVGTVLMWTTVRLALPTYPLVAGWTGMVGLIFILHFGLFHLLSVRWRAAGVNAPPLMRAPLLSRSLGEFWGRRWNTAFNQLTTKFLFHPLRRVVGVRTATMLVFLASGLVHDFVISVPARGGYGLPTLYFLLQGAGVLFEHTNIARRCGLDRGFRGWLFTLAITAGPAFWLFHPAFIHNVILPMLRALGAT